LIVIFLFTISYTQKEITENQAISLAEEFVRINGYTLYLADTNNVKFEPNSDSDGDLKTVLEYRHNTIHPKAFCLFKYSDSWHIGFLSTRIKLECLDSLSRQSNLLGRVVTVNLNGTVLRMTHKFPKFSNWKKL
jgi:hypothetical protein